MINPISRLLNQHSAAWFAIVLCACSAPTSPKQDGTVPSGSEAPPSTTTPPPTSASAPLAKARNVAGKAHMSAVSQGQMAYNLENGTFAQTIDELGLDLEAENFTLAVLDADQAKATFTAIAKKPGLQSYAGGVSQLQDVSYSAILCESSQPSQDIAPPTLAKDAWNCGPESLQVDAKD